MAIPRDRTFFLYVGTDKAASTWIYEVLRAHPDCFVPDIKDIYYFDQNYERGTAWYASFFDGVQPHHRAVGELSHDYLHSPEACERIGNDFPETRILVSIREPVSRAFSNYLFLRRHGMTRGTFREALDEFPELVECGLYADAIRRYRERFGADNVHVTLFDDVRRDGDRAAQVLYRFLGLDEDAPPPAQGKTLPAAEPRNPALSLMAKKAAIWMRRAGMLHMIGRIKTNPLVQRLLYREYDAYPVLDPADRAFLEPVFAEDIAATEELLGIDLRSWRERT